jgi:NAD(P)H dehydrogenase (quinone)
MIAVTGASGHFGQLAVEALLARGIPAGEIAAVARTPEKIAGLAERGVQVRRADYTDPASLTAAFAGVGTLLFVSGSEVGQRVPQHTNVVKAAVDAGVGRIAYTGIVNGERNHALLAREHQATEAVIRDSGVPHTFLRNGWYLENYTAQLPGYLERGVITGSADDGRISAATRADYAEAAVVAVTREGHENAVYELGGDAAFTMTELAALASEITGVHVEYHDLPLDEYTQVLVAAGLPEQGAAVYADSDLAIARGELYTDSGDLARLLGRRPVTLDEALRAAAKEA